MNLTTSFRRRSSGTIALALALPWLFSFSGCASLKQNADCALIGMGVGLAGGVIVGATQNDVQTEEVIGAAAIGGAAGAVVGYGVCALTTLGD